MEIHLSMLFMHFFKILGKFPLFTDPSPGYHGLKFWDVFGGEKVRVKICVSLLTVDQ